MAISADDVRRIRRTWALAAMAQERAARIFYADLFKRAPETAPLFRSDIKSQGRKLTQTLGYIVDHLDDLETLTPSARDLAMRHLDYGVVAEHYAYVGQSLVYTLRSMLEGDFTDRDQQAWERVYGLLSGLMIDDAYEKDRR